MFTRKYLKQKHISNLALAILLVFSGATAGWAYTNLTNSAATSGFHSENFTRLAVPLPTSVQELVATSSVIVIGRIDKVVGESSFAGYDNATGKLLKEPAQLSEPTRQAFRNKGQALPGVVPFTDYEIKVDQTLLDNGTLAKGQPLILRILGQASLAKKGLATLATMPQVGETGLFALAANPDKTTFGLLYGDCSRFTLNTETVYCANSDSSQLDFTKKLKPAEFIEQVKQALKGKA